jgi:hypothetical protein
MAILRTPTLATPRLSDTQTNLLLQSWQTVLEPQLALGTQAIQGKPVPVPLPANDQQVLQWSQSAGAFQFTAKGSGATGTAGTTTLYEIDFTNTLVSGSNVTLANGNNTFANGQVWVASGIGTGTSVKLNPSAGTGIVISQGAVGSNYNVQVGLTAPTMVALGAQPWQPTTCYWFYAGSTTSTATSGGGAISRPQWGIANAAGTYYMLAANAYGDHTGQGGINGAEFFNYLFFNSTTYPTSSYSNYTTTNLTDNVIVFQVISFWQINIYSGAWSSGWPTWTNLNFRGMLYGAPASATPINWHYPTTMADFLFTASIYTFTPVGGSTTGASSMNLYRFRITQ